MLCNSHLGLYNGTISADPVARRACTALTACTGLLTVGCFRSLAEGSVSSAFACKLALP